MAASAGLHTLFVVPELHFYRTVISTGRWKTGEVSGWLLQALTFGYLLVPLLFGLLSERLGDGVGDRAVVGW
ncbi:hypothetical protein [Actinokineospora globicatena]|uniref:hypothetical protein n=1 Tax=Actinokineospora globicatena TaxID=103729 RepID=UPI002552F78D|nr:hypothetical protein [Actinokineospora globicatena]